MNKYAKRTGVLLLISFALFIPTAARAHCDTMNGPVISDAVKALATGDVTPVLKWVNKESEAEIREAFVSTMAVRSKGPEAKKLADNYFFETLVRIHRAGEGAPYTGIKPAGTPIDPAVEEADKALESGSADALLKRISDEISDGIKRRFERALENKKYSSKSVEAGREYVEAYIQFVHYVERLHLDATTDAEHHGQPGESAGEPDESHR
jgi:hypothetical protein